MLKQRNLTRSNVVLKKPESPTHSHLSHTCILSILLTTHGIASRGSTKKKIGVIEILLPPSFPALPFSSDCPFSAICQFQIPTIKTINFKVHRQQPNKQFVQTTTYDALLHNGTTIHVSSTFESH